MLSGSNLMFILSARFGILCKTSERANGPQPSSQGSNSHSLSPTHDSTFGYSSLPKIEHEILYHQLHSIRPITRQLVKEFGLILGIQHLPYTSRKPKFTPTGVVVSSVEEAILTTIEALTEAIKYGEEPPVLRQGKQDILVILRSDFVTGGRGEGSGGGKGRDKPTDSELEPSDSKREEEDEEEEEMANRNKEWMT